MKKDIAKAIEAEEEYIRLTLAGESPDIHDFLDQWGYSNLKTFHNDKVEYQLKQLDWDIVHQPKIDLAVTEYDLTNKIPAFMYSIFTGETYAFVRNNYEHIKELEDMGYVVIKMGYNATNGLILSFDGDLRVYLIIPNTIDVDEITFLQKMKKYFVSLGLNAVVDNNDILVDNKKVCGSGLFTINGMLNIVYQISFTDHVEEIKRICGETAKEPGFIPQSILTPEQLKNKFIEWLQ